jgi:hypothetical protein
MAVRTRHVVVEPAVRRRLEHAGQRLAPPRGHVETLRGHVENLRGHIGAPRGHIETPRSHFENPRSRFQPSKRPARRLSELRDSLERRFLHISAILFFVGSVGWCWLVFSEFRTPILVSPAEATYSAAGVGKADSEISKSDPFSSSTYARANDPHTTGSLGASSLGASLGGESPASIVAREWSRLQTRVTERARAPAKQAQAQPSAKQAQAQPSAKQAQAQPSAKQAQAQPQAPAQTQAANEPKPSLKPPVRLASLEDAPPPAEEMPSRMPSNVGAVTSLVNFETAPFPYHGTMPGTDRPFLNAGDANHRGHVNFRGHVLWESQTFNDDRVLLHIPAGFDPSRPAVMVVFFHGHGANLATDVRDRQLVPAQITAAGANAVLVAPQFAVDAADSSAGKFWEPNGFKRFLDEAAVKLARQYGDPRAAFTFARMPIVIVSYSGGFGPTLAVLDRGGVRSRVRGLILLDSLYAGIDKFADWIAQNRSTFFVSSYTPHTAHHNADLERLLRERSVPYSAELRRDHLQGMVTFLPAGDVSHRNFVTHAWSDNPIKDILVRMDDIDTKNGATAATASVPANAASSSRD